MTHHHHSSSPSSSSFHGSSSQFIPSAATFHGSSHAFHFSSPPPISLSPAFSLIPPSPLLLPPPNTPSSLSNRSPTNRGRSNQGRSNRTRRGSISFCFVVPLFVAVLGILGSLVVILGIHASQNLEMGRNYSRILSANSVFVKRIVVESHLITDGPILYGFSKVPALDRENDWTEDHKIIVPGNYHQEWVLWLNKGSKAKLECDITPRNSKLLMAVIQGEDHFYEWTRDPTNPSFMSSYKTVEGKGVIHIGVKKDDAYFFALGNLGQSDAQVNFKLDIFSKIYNTEYAASKCYVGSKTCSLELPFLGSDIALIMAPEVQDEVDVWPVKVIYKTRWATYLIPYGAIVLVELFIVLRFYRRQTHQHTSQADSENAPLVVFPEEGVTTACIKSPDSDPEADQHTDSNTGNEGQGSGGSEEKDENLCAICFESRKDCFFDPCGHCATCYQCGLRVKGQRNPVCPICRQSVRSVRKIFLT